MTNIVLLTLKAKKYCKTFTNNVITVPSYPKRWEEQFFVLLQRKYRRNMKNSFFMKTAQKSGFTGRREDKGKNCAKLVETLFIKIAKKGKSAINKGDFSTKSTGKPVQNFLYYILIQKNT